MSTSTPTRQTRADETRRLLLDAAQDIFAERGYHQAGMDDIVQAADRSKGAAYFHFPSKRDIFEAVLERLADRLEDKVEKALAGQTAAVARLEIALLTVLETFTNHRRMARLALIDLMGAGPEFDAVLGKTKGRFADLIKHQLDAAVDEGAIDPINTRLVSQAWLGAINEFVTNWLRSATRTPPPDEIEELRSTLLRSVGLSGTDSNSSTTAPAVAES